MTSKPTLAHAARRAAHRNHLHLTLPGLGVVELPPTEQLAFTAGMAGLAVTGMIEWPVAAVLVTAHLMADLRHHKTLQGFAEALEEA